MPYDKVRASELVNEADLQRALPSRQPISQARINVNKMNTVGGSAPPIKPQNAKHSTFCPTCGDHHRHGTMCAEKNLNIEYLLDFIKADTKNGVIFSKPNSTRGGNPYHSAENGRFTSKDGGAGARGKSDLKDIGKVTTAKLSTVKKPEPLGNATANLKKPSTPAAPNAEAGSQEAVPQPIDDDLEVIPPTSPKSNRPNLPGIYGGVDDQGRHIFHMTRKEHSDHLKQAVDARDAHAAYLQKERGKSKEDADLGAQAVFNYKYLGDSERRPESIVFKPSEMGDKRSDHREKDPAYWMANQPQPVDDTASENWKNMLKQYHDNKQANVGNAPSQTAGTVSEGKPVNNAVKDTNSTQQLNTKDIKFINPEKTINLKTRDLQFPQQPPPPPAAAMKPGSAKQLPGPAGSPSSSATPGGTSSSATPPPLPTSNSSTPSAVSTASTTPTATKKPNQGSGGNNTNTVGGPSAMQSFRQGWRSGARLGDPFSPGQTFIPSIRLAGSGLHALLSGSQNTRKSIDHLDKLSKYTNKDSK